MIYGLVVIYVVSFRKSSSSSRPLVSTIYRSDAEHFHTILDTISQSACDAMDPPEDHIFESCTHLTIVPATDCFSNSHGVFAQCICGRPRLVEYLLRDVVFSLILVCASASRLDIWPEEGEEKECLEHNHCYHTMEYCWILFLLCDPTIVRLVLNNDSLERLLRWHHLGWYSRLKSYCLFYGKVSWQTSKKIADSINIQLATEVRVGGKTR